MYLVGLVDLLQNEPAPSIQLHGVDADTSLITNIKGKIESVGGSAPTPQVFFSLS